MKQILSVTQLNQTIKSMMDAQPILQNVCVRGEISNYKVYPSGHHYFTLKDTESAVRCVMFKGYASSLRFRPDNGMAVLAVGRVSVFPRDGAYQLYCSSLTPDGVGDLHVAFEQLKEKLASQGLFDPTHKKPIPAYPQMIAIVTSQAGAAIHDMLRILGRRFPLSTVRLLPVRVQGAEAPAEIVGAIRYANRWQLGDVLIVGRGGGSIEDLWAFNDERVARAIYDSLIPVISAVGHEPDVTISDYVADLRAATPSNAAELAVPDQQELRAALRSMEGALQQAMSKRLKLARQQLRLASSSSVLQSPTNYIQDRRMRLDAAYQRLLHLAETGINRKKQQFVRLTAALDAMSPLAVLTRGYSVAFDSRGHVLRSADQVSIGEALEIKTGCGSLQAAVTGKEEETYGAASENL